MKHILLAFVLITTLISCSFDNDTPSFYLETLPIEDVEVPEEFVFGETYEIFVDYIKPTECYVFNDFIYEIDGQERTIGVINTVYTNNNCEENSELVRVSFQLSITSYETHIFKFYQGENMATNFAKYHIVEVPVVN